MVVNEILLFTFQITLVLFIKLSWDIKVRYIEKNVINHTLSVLLDSLAYFIILVSMYGFEDIMQFNVILMFLYAYFFRWFFFDLLYNFYTNKKYNYLGQTSKLDKMMKPVRNWLLFIKLFFLLFIFLLLLLF